MVYASAPIYRVFVLASGVMACLFVWQLSNGFDVGALLFLGVTLWLTVRYGRMAASRVELGADRVRLVQPYAAPVEVEYRQVQSVYQEGRGFQSVLVTYHPRQADGLLDLDDVKQLALPAVRDHAGLFNALTAHVPQ